MTQKIYGLTHDNGDGSCSIHWFQSKEIVDKILNGKDADYRHEAYYGNEGSPSETLTFPADMDLVSCGFMFNDDEYLEP